MYKVISCTINLKEESAPIFLLFEEEVENWIRKGYMPLTLTTTPVLFNGFTSALIYTQALYKGV